MTAINLPRRHPWGAQGVLAQCACAASMTVLIISVGVQLCRFRVISPLVGRGASKPRSPLRSLLAFSQQSTRSFRAFSLGWAVRVLTLLGACRACAVCLVTGGPLSPCLAAPKAPGIAYTIWGSSLLRATVVCPCPAQVSLPSCSEPLRSRIWCVNCRLSVSSVAKLRV